MKNRPHVKYVSVSNNETNTEPVYEMNCIVVIEIIKNIVPF